MSTDLAELEIKLGYSFKNRELLRLALTHSSLANERQQTRAYSNERLEFLGDAVLELTVSEYIFECFPELTEGELTRIRAGVVCEASLSRVAAEMNLGSYLLMSRGEHQTGGRTRPSTISDAFEAVAGAIYKDGGSQAAESFILGKLEPYILQMRTEFKKSDAKTHFQELIQRKSPIPAEYRLISESGPDHDKLFTIGLYHKGELLAQASGRSKKDAEQAAAALALETLV